MDPDDPLASLDFDVDAPDVVDVTKLTAFGLAELRTSTREALKALHELWTPPHSWSAEARELHALLTALQIEAHRRLADLESS